ncbi:hypothetical protein RSAG8_10878, partial [Rhizoctonia solani AG-8 WAC10335]
MESVGRYMYSDSYNYLDLTTFPNRQLCKV